MAGRALHASGGRRGDAVLGAAAGAGDVSFVAQGVKKQIGQAGLTAAADLTKHQRIDVYVQISAAADYVVVSNVSGEYVYAKDAPAYTPPAFPARIFTIS